MLPTVPPQDTRVAAARQLAADGRWRDVSALLESTGASAELSGELLLLRGEAHLRSGDAPGAHRWLPDAIFIARFRHDYMTERALWNQYGAACFELGRLDEAEHAFIQALDRAREEGDDLLLARTSNNLGMIANIRGQQDLAVGQYQLAIPAYQRLGHLRGLAETYHNLALTARERRALDASEHYERQAIDFAEQARDQRLALMGEIGLAEVGLLRGDHDLSEKRAIVAAQRCGSLGDHANEADAFRIAGVAQLASGQTAAAGRSLNRAVSLARQHGAALIEAEGLAARAQCQLARGESGLAREDAWRAVRLFDRLRSSQGTQLRRWISASNLGGDVPA